MKRFLAVLILSCGSLFAASDLYVSTIGNDSTGAGTAINPWATVAKAISTVPAVLDTSYTIHLADGSYAEGLDLSGFVGTGLAAGAGSKSITILGNTGTPANVQLTGAVSCAGSNAIACLNSSAGVTLSGIKLNGTAARGIICSECSFILSNAVVTGTLTGGVDVYKGLVLIENSVTISGFTDLALYLAHVSAAIQDVNGTLTITGPGGSSTTAVGIVGEFIGSYAMIGGSTNVTISGVQIGVLLSSESTFNSFVSTGTISITNSATPANSFGVRTTGTSSFNVSGTGLTVNHFTKCLSAAALSVIDQGPGNRSLGTCTNTDAQQGSQIVLF